MFVHPYDCTSRKYPTNCRDCGQLVIYWECLHGAKVFFEPPDRGDHRNLCPAMRAPSGGAATPRPDGRTALGTLEGVSGSVQTADYGLMPGMKRVGPVVAEIRRSLDKMPESGQRATERMNPYGYKSETIVGEVSDMFEIDLADKFDIAPNSIGGRTLGKIFPGLRAAQITILVDEFLNDPDAVDKMSYTAWCPMDIFPGGLAKRSFAAAEISPRELPIIGRKWIVKSVDELKIDRPENPT